MKALVLFVFCLSFISVAHGAKSITITDDCVYLDELASSSTVPHTKVACGIGFGETRTFSKDVIQNFLARSGINANVLHEVAVTRAGEKISEKAVATFIEQEYKRAYPEISVNIDQLRLPKDIYAENLSDFQMKFDTAKFGANYVEINNGVNRRQVYFYAKAFKEGFVTIERVRLGDRLETKVRKELIEVTNLRSPLATNLSGLISTKNINQGRPVTDELTTQEPALKKGEKVRIVYDNGGLKIETAGVIEADAFIGQTVPVRNVASQKVISASYVGGGIVKPF